MRLRARRDANHAEVVAGLRAVGLSVLDLAPLGHGCPDLLVGHPRGNVLLEIKDGTKPPSARALTPDEQRFLATWRGPRAVVGSLAEAIEALRAWGVWSDEAAAPVVRCCRDPRSGTPESAAPQRAGGGPRSAG